MEQDPQQRQSNPEAYDHRAEHGRSFDLASSISLIRHDLDNNNGQIHDATMERIRNEELTYIAEGINRRAYTKFTLQRDDANKLIFFDEGEWRPYVGTLLRGQEVAHKEAKEDKRRQFLADLSTRDLIVGYDMQNLRRGQVMVWSSSFPAEAWLQYGTYFMKECGFQPDRKMGFLYRAECNEDGSVTLESHTIDNSDPEIFTKVEAIMNYDKTASLEILIRSYDGHMRTKHGGKYKAGRRVQPGVEEEDAYAFLVSNEALLDYYFDQIVALAHQRDLNGEALGKAKQRLTFGVWARVKELLNEYEQQPGTITTPRYEPVYFEDPHEQFAYEIQRAYNEANARNDMLIGCGGGIGGKALEDMSPSEALEAIFGSESPVKKKEKAKYDFDTEMYCVGCQAPPKDGEAMKWCGPCGLCEACDKEYPDD